MTKAFEKWKEVPGYNGIYWVSSHGNIRSKKKILSLNKDRDGYLLFHARKNGIRKVFKVHRLVIRVFRYESKKPVNHKDGDKKNNSLDNLEYTTTRENTLHAVYSGLYRARLKPEVVIQIRKDINLGIKRGLILKKYGIKRSNYYYIRDNLTWKHV